MISGTESVQQHQQHQQQQQQQQRCSSVSNNGTQWTPDFSPDSVTIIVKDMVQDLTISSLEIPIAAFNSLINQRQQFLDNHLARVPITPNHQGTWEMQDEVRASVRDRNVSSDFVPSDLDDIQFHWVGVRT